MKNFKKIKDKILQTKSGFQVSNTEQLTKKISDLLNNKNLFKKTINNFEKLRVYEAKKVKILIKQECDKIK